MAASSENNETKGHGKCVEMVQSVLDGKQTIEEFKANMKDCDESDNLEKIIKDCLKNKVERKCCPEKIVNELKLKIGIGVLLALGLLLNFKLIHEIFNA